MCKNQRWIVNKYNGRKYLVNCGVCDVCLQQKADKRANLLRLLNLPKDYFPYFVTLTYSNDFVPFIKLSELPYCKPIEKQDFIIRVYRSKDYNHYKSAVVTKEFCINHKYIEYDLLDSSIDSIYKFKNLTGREGIGVLNYKDIQKFIKRLRANYDIPFYAVTGEYGGNLLRPHWHLLIYTKVKPDILKYWHYGFITCDKAIDVSQYIASYINSNLSNIHPFIKKFFPQIYKRSNSLPKYHIFSLETIFNVFQEKHTTILEYSFMSAKKLENRSIFVPTPLLNYYFPNYNIIKYFRCPSDFYEMFSTLNIISKEYELFYKAGQNKPFELLNHPLTVSIDTMFSRFYEFAKLLDITIFDYICFMFQYFTCRASEMFKQPYSEFGIIAFITQSADLFYYFKDDLFSFCEDYNLNYELLKSIWLNVKDLDYEQCSVYLCNDDYYRNRFYQLDKFHRVNSQLISLQSI